MTRVVEIPTSFDDRTFDQMAAGIGEWPPKERLLFDARTAQWGSPYAFTGLLTAGQALAALGAEKPLLTVPESADVCRYWARMRLFEYAAEYFELHGKVPKPRAAGATDTLLDITPIRAAEDVHEVVERIGAHATRILTHELGLAANAAMGFSMALSESCQNIVEHAGTGGWVAAQTYTYRRRLAGRRVVVIAVSDAGIGFRRSLEPTQGKRFGDRWRDGTAVEAALIHSVSRFRDPGRGQGYAWMRRYVARWDGKLSVRSGTARLAIVPSWDDEEPLKEHLPFFPGAQVQVTIPGTAVAE
jgi:anti-sigma regulatory factor (Ser/Thr protein kinase)